MLAESLVSERCSHLLLAGLEDVVIFAKSVEAESYSLYNKSLTYYNAQIYGTVHFSILYKKGVLPAVPHIETYSLYTVHEHNSCMKQVYFVFIF